MAINWLGTLIFRARGPHKKRIKSALGRKGRHLVRAREHTVLGTGGTLSYVRVDLLCGIRRLRGDFARGVRIPSAGRLVRVAPAVEDAQSGSASAVNHGAETDLRR